MRRREDFVALPVLRVNCFGVLFYVLHMDFHMKLVYKDTCGQFLHDMISHFETNTVPVQLLL